MSFELSSTHLIMPLALGALTAMAHAPAPQLVFAPQEGSELSARFEQHWELRLEEQRMSMVIDGEETPQGGAEVEITIETHDDYTFAIEVLEVQDGRVTRLQRTLERAIAVSGETAQAPDGETYEETREGETQLEGVPIVFEWDEADEDYRASFGDDAEVEDDDLLEGLVGADVLERFLPPEAVEEGDTWEVDIVAFRHLSNPGGDLKIVKEGDAEDQDEFEQAFHDNLEGEIVAEHLGTRDEDGTELLVIGLEVSVETVIDRSRELGDDRGSVDEVFEFGFELEGEMLWDGDAGHGTRLDLEGAISLSLAREQQIDNGSNEITIELGQDFEGDFDYRAVLE